MRKNFLLISAIIGFAFCWQLRADEGDISAASALEQEGEFELASEMFFDNFKSTPTVSNCKLLIDFNQRLLNSLSKEISRRGNTYFVPPDAVPDSTVEKMGKFNKGLLKISSFLYIDGGYTMRKMNDALLKSSAEDAQIRATRAIKMELPNAEKAKEILDRYDIIKNNISKMEAILKREIKKNAGNREEILDSLRAVRAQKKQLKKDRTDYVSYMVISPYLAEVKRLLFLAKNNYWALKGKDKEAMDQAVKMLAFSCHKEWLYQSDDSTREQFIDIQRELKQIATKEEIEDYKVITTLVDSVDTSKKRGADAWME